MRGHQSTDFYCMNCGKKNIPVYRNNGRMKEHYHRKKLYCPWCKTEGNHVECRNDVEVKEFLRAFEAGEFEEELKESLKHIKEHDWPL